MGAPARPRPRRACRVARGGRGSRGFNLTEVMISLAILGMIGALTFGTFTRAMAARERATAITERYHSVRQAMGRMAREISMAFLSQNRDCADMRSLTVFSAHRASHGMRLNFTSFSHYKMRADAKESDQNELSYFVDTDADDSRRKNLMRREQSRIDERPEEGGVVQVLADDVESLDFEFYNPKSDQWQDDWDATAADTRDRLPKYVTIKLVVRDHLGKSLHFSTKTRVFLKEANFIPGLGRGRCLE